MRFPQIKVANQARSAPRTPTRLHYTFHVTLPHFQPFGSAPTSPCFTNKPPCCRAASQAKRAGRRRPRVHKRPLPPQAKRRTMAQELTLEQRWLGANVSNGVHRTEVLMAADGLEDLRRADRTEIEEIIASWPAPARHQFVNAWHALRGEPRRRRRPRPRPWRRNPRPRNNK